VTDQWQASRLIGTLQSSLNHQVHVRTIAIDFIESKTACLSCSGNKDNRPETDGCSLKKSLPDED